MIRVRYHSDCDYFAGCENMLANFFADERLAGEGAASFSYRSSPAYEEGLKSRVPAPPRLLPVAVFDFHQISGLANSWPAPLRLLYKALTRLLLVKYWLMLWNVWRLYASMSGETIEILHINNGGFPGAASCLAAGPAARLRGIKTVVHVVNNLPRPYDGPDRWLDWPLDRLAAGSATMFVTGSAQARSTLVRALGLPEAKAVNLANGIAPRAVTEDPQALRRRLAVKDRPLLAVVAVLEPRKGHAVLFEALAKLRAEGLSPFPVTALGGDGSLRAELEALAKSLGLSDDVLFLGWEKRHFDLFNAADAVVLPSTGYEDFPNVTIEAMGLGKAVVATKVGGVSEQLEDGVSGLLAAPGDAADLARALGAVLREPGLRERLGRAARERFEERFTAEASVDRYLTLYQSLLSEAPK
ncbi:MAG: glycosyltransferase family 4 protein [Elusimicrobia bacterium]|nr:glycosyltransferase family 4 protein [Elusimicrobiota bacterium]